MSATTFREYILKTYFVRCIIMAVMFIAGHTKKTELAIWVYADELSERCEATATNGNSCSFFLHFARPGIPKTIRWFLAASKRMLHFANVLFPTIRGGCLGLVLLREMRKPNICEVRSNVNLVARGGTSSEGFLRPSRGQELIWLVTGLWRTAVGRIWNGACAILCKCF